MKSPIFKRLTFWNLKELIFRILENVEISKFFSSRIVEN